MKDHILEFVTPGTSLRKNRGLLEIRMHDKKHEIPFADIQGCIIVSPEVHLSTAVITELINYGVSIQVTDKKYNPLGVMLPLVGHYLQKVRHESQIVATDFYKGKLWQKVIIKKVQNQERVLRSLQKEHGLLNKFSMEIKAKDLNNIEAQAARFYWRQLFGLDFIRDAQMPGINSFLNYGYAILRSAVARSVVSCGLSPSLGIFHCNMENPFCLVDDLMEPFRPFVDEIAYVYRDREELDTEIKRALVPVLEMPMWYGGQKKVMRNVIHEYCQSFARSMLEKDLSLFNLEFDKVNETESE